MCTYHTTVIMICQPDGRQWLFCTTAAVAGKHPGARPS